MYQPSLRDRRLLYVSGRRAQFTHPLSRTNWSTYPIITPAAARGVMMAIHGKPEFEWAITDIVVLSEIDSVYEGFQAANDKLESRRKTQIRQRSVLTDVEYVIGAVPYVLSPNVRGAVAKHLSIFDRRMRRGQYHERPYLGKHAYVVDDYHTVDELPHGIDVTIDFGTMPATVRTGVGREGKQCDVRWEFLPCDMVHGHVSFDPAYVVPDGA